LQVATLPGGMETNWRTFCCWIRIWWWAAHCTNRVHCMRLLILRNISQRLSPLNSEFHTRIWHNCWATEELLFDQSSNGCSRSG
jgi:hypothetical protein